MTTVGRKSNGKKVILDSRRINVLLNTRNQDGNFQKTGKPSLY